MKAYGMAQKTIFVCLVFCLASCAPSPSTPERGAETTNDRIFAAHDRDRNGCLSQAEWTQMTNMALNALKADAPDNLEQVAGWHREEFTRRDANNDQCVSREEFLADAGRPQPPS